MVLYRHHYGYQITTTASSNESEDPTGQNFSLGLSRSPIKIPPGVQGFK